MTLNEAIAKLDELEKSTYALNHAQSILYVDGDTVAPARACGRPHRREGVRVVPHGQRTLGGNREG